MDLGPALSPMSRVIWHKSHSISTVLRSGLYQNQDILCLQQDRKMAFLPRPGYASEQQTSPQGREDKSGGAEQEPPVDSAGDPRTDSSLWLQESPQCTWGQDVTQEKPLPCPEFWEQV